MRTRIFILLIGFVACREVEDPVDIGYDYFPIEVGNEWIYQIDSVHYYDFSETVDTFKLYRKEYVVEVADMASEETRYNIDVFLKTDTTEWEYKSSIVTYKNSYRAVRVDKNKPIMHLLFPVKDRVYWDANQLNNDREDRFRYIDTEKHRSMMRDTFPNNIFVQQAHDTAIIDEDIRWELYADGVGLVEKQKIEVPKQFDKRNGFEIHWKLLSFTKKQ
jgi:hypothetical protein